MTSPERYAELFASEAREQLAAIARGLVALESQPDDPEPLEAVFRSAHTLKGMAAAMGYAGVNRLAHALESVLDDIRSGARAVDAALTDVLLHAADVLEELVEAAVAGGEEPDADAIIESLGISDGEQNGGRAALDRERARKGAARGRGAEPSSRPASSRIRVEIQRLDRLMNLVGELVIVRSRLESLARESGSEPLLDAVDRATRLVGDIQNEVMESRMVPVWQVFDRFPRAVRDAARAVSKEVELAISGKDLELDRSVLEVIADPLIHLLRNAVDHGIELPDERESNGKPRAGRIELAAHRERSRVLIVVSDDGRGVDRSAVLRRAHRLGIDADEETLTDAEIFRIISQSGFSTRGEVTTLSGRGVGLDVVEDAVRRCGGSIGFQTMPGAGTAVTLELPLTLAIVRALLVEVGGEEYAVPTAYARESFELSSDRVESAHGREWVTWRGEVLPLTRLQSLFGLAGTAANGGAGDRMNGGARLRLIALEAAGAKLAVSVDRLVGEREVVVKSFDPPRGTLPIFTGATVRPDGRPALIIDVGSLA